MALSLGFETPHDLLKKVERDFFALEAAISAQDKVRISDALYNFSVSVTSLKDWLKLHTSSSYTAEDVERLVANSVALSSFRDIANASKHRLIKRYTPTTDETTISAMPLSHMATLGDMPREPNKAFRTKIIRSDGERLDASTLARSALHEWHEFMNRHGLLKIDESSTG